MNSEMRSGLRRSLRGTEGPTLVRRLLVFATGMFQAGQTIDDPPDAIIVGNPNKELSATVELYFAPEGSNIEDLVEGPIELMPGDS